MNHTPSYHTLHALLLLLACGLSGPGWTQTTASDHLRLRAEMVSDEAATISRERSELAEWRGLIDSRLAKLGDESLTLSEVERSRLDVETQKAKGESIKLDLTTAEQRQAELELSIKELKGRLQTLAAVKKDDLVKGEIVQTEQNLSERERLLEIELRHIRQLAERRQLVAERLALTEQWHAELDIAYQGQQEQLREQTLEGLEKQLDEERQVWQEKAKKYRTQLEAYRSGPSPSPSKRVYAESLLVEAEDAIFLIDIRLKVARIRMGLDVPQVGSTVERQTLTQLRGALEELAALKGQATSLNELLTVKTQLLRQRREVVSKQQSLDSADHRDYQRAEMIFKRLLERATKQLAELSAIRQEIDGHTRDIDARYLQQKRRGLSERHQLNRPLEAWQQLFDEVRELPQRLLQLGKETVLGLWTALLQADLWRVVLLGILALTGLLVGRWQQPSEDETAAHFSQRLLQVGRELLHGNRWALLFGGMLIVASWLVDINPTGLAVIGSLLAIWIAARLTIGISHRLLVSPAGMRANLSGLQRSTVVFTLLLASLVFILTLGLFELVSPSLMDLVERLVMALMLPAAYLAMRSRRLLVDRIGQLIVGGYWLTLIRLISFVIPMAIFIAAIFGLIGYINLSWSIAWHLAIFISVVSLWLVIRGLVVDAAHATQKLLLQRSERGLFLVKSVVEPLQFLLRLALFLLALWTIYRLFGGEEATGLNLRGGLKYPLFTIGDNVITGLDLLRSLVLLVLVFYLGRWAREVTYGWLYGTIRDLGIRNSLSVFTQYAVVVVGLLIALNIIGIDLTSLTVFAGALGVGIGFGLQNIANNFISGLILLVERPVRTKDWVTIGDKEGEVSQIGMRSVTVTTWDNQDVIIPNADLVSNAFINWTRTDSQVRTVLIIGIRYQDDPHHAQTVIEEAVAMVPEVSLTPGPRVWLSEFGPSSVDFRVHYYMDVEAFGRFEVKSKVLFAIWDALKGAGIGIPFPQQDIYIKELPPARPDTEVGGGPSSALGGAGG